MTMARDMHERAFESEHEESARAWWPAVKRGFGMRCPNCGEGALFRAYLKVNEACPKCGEELHHHRADDAPPYLTIFFVGHIVAAFLMIVDERYPALPIGVHMVVWPLMAILLSLWLLPRFKGALIAYQWALRMHGFETALPTRSQTQ